MAMLTEVTINGIDVSTYLRTWANIETFGHIVTDIAVQVRRSILNVIPTLGNGMTMVVKRGTTTATDEQVFNGTIDNITKSGAVINILGKDQLAKLINESVNKSYDGVSFPSTEAKGSDIAKDLIETFGGMTATVVDTGDTIIVKEFICRDTDVLSRLQILGVIFDYQIYFSNVDSTVHFEPKGTTSSTTILSTGTNIMNVPRWDLDNSQLVNILKVKGANQEIEQNETFDGDGTASQVFTLSFSPIFVSMFEVVAAVDVQKIPGVVSSTPEPFDYTVDKENKKVTTTSDWTPASGTDNVKTTYSRAIPAEVTVDDEISIDKYGKKRGVKFFDDIQTVDDAIVRGRAWIDKYSVPFVQTRLEVSHTLIDLRVGNKITVVDTINNENREVIINRIKKTYPHKADIIDVGDKEWRIEEWGKFTIERLRRLEEKTAGDTGILIQVKTFNHTLIHARRYLRVKKRNWSGRRELHLDSETLGLLDTQYWVGDTDEGFPEFDDSFRVVFPDDIYDETFLDEDFKGASSANWDTTNRRLSYS